MLLDDDLLLYLVLKSLSREVPVSMNELYNKVRGDTSFIALHFDIGQFDKVINIVGEELLTAKWADLHHEGFVLTKNRMKIKASLIRKFNASKKG